MPKIIFQPHMITNPAGRLAGTFAFIACLRILRMPSLLAARPEKAKALKMRPFCNISVKVLDLHQEIGGFLNFSPKTFVCEHKSLYLCTGIKKEG